MKRGMKILLGAAAGTMLLGMATPFAWADGGAACRGGAMRSAWLGTTCRVTEA